ncbi:MAG: DoxX family protein [Mesorhizobium sp.]|nr:DoxX family protein [Mesorhizobium sp.]MCO5160324.1 DoxX family protein [Mesorhizobium sp.]
MNTSILLVAARLLLAFMFIGAGLQKFTDIPGTAGYIASVSLPAPTLLAWLSAIFETVAGIAILVGYQTRIVAALLALFCVFTAFWFHFGAIAIPDFPEAANGMLSMMNQLLFMKNLTIAGGFLALIATGPGSLSLDARLGKVA